MRTTRVLPATHLASSGLKERRQSAVLVHQPLELVREVARSSLDLGPGGRRSSKRSLNFGLQEIKPHTRSGRFKQSSKRIKARDAPFPGSFCCAP